MRPTPDRQGDNNQANREENASMCLSRRSERKNDGAKTSRPGDEAKKIFLQPRHPSPHQLQDQLACRQTHDKREPGSEQYSE
jgi:hypothetical protein